MTTRVDVATALVPTRKGEAPLLAELRERYIQFVILAIYVLPLLTVALWRILRSAQRLVQ